MRVNVIVASVSILWYALWPEPCIFSSGKIKHPILFAQWHCEHLSFLNSLCIGPFFSCTYDYSSEDLEPFAPFGTKIKSTKPALNQECVPCPLPATEIKEYLLHDNEMDHNLLEHSMHCVHILMLIYQGNWWISNPWNDCIHAHSFPVALLSLSFWLSVISLFLHQANISYFSIHKAIL